MKSLLSTLFLNVGMAKRSARLDPVLPKSEAKQAVNASGPTTVPCV